MKVTYLRYLDFHTPSKEEVKKIRKKQRKRRFQSFFKRFLIISLITLIIVACQAIARQTVPLRFKAANTVEVLYTKAAWGFLIANIISWLQLMFMHYFYFQKKTAEVVFVRVHKKLTKVYTQVFTNWVREIYCDCLDETVEVEEQYVEGIKETDDAVFIDDRIFVDGIIDYSNIKEGEVICVERFEDEGKYTYHFVA